MEGELLYLRIVSERTTQFTVSAYILETLRFLCLNERKVSLVTPSHLAM